MSKKTLRKVVKRLLVFVLVIALLISAPPVMASWLSWLGVGCTVVAIGAAFFPPVGTAVAGVLGISQIVIIAVDVVRTLTGVIQTDDDLPPDFVGPPEPDAYANGLSLLGGHFQQLPLQGDATDDLVNAANSMIDGFNMLLADVNNGASQDQINADLLDLSTAIDRVADEYDRLNFQDVELTQAAVDSAQQDVRLNGLPDFEVQILQNAGLSAGAIADFAQYVAQAPVNLSAPSVSPGELLRTSAAGIRAGI